MSKSDLKKELKIKIDGKELIQLLKAFEEKIECGKFRRKAKTIWEIIIRFLTQNTDWRIEFNEIINEKLEELYNTKRFPSHYDEYCNGEFNKYLKRVILLKSKNLTKREKKIFYKYYANSNEEFDFIYILSKLYKKDWVF